VAASASTSTTRAAITHRGAVPPSVKAAQPPARVRAALPSTTGSLNVLPLASTCSLSLSSTAPPRLPSNLAPLTLLPFQSFKSVMTRPRDMRGRSRAKGDGEPGRVAGLEREQAQVLERLGAACGRGCGIGKGATLRA